jgi:hypothetical protein
LSQDEDEADYDEVYIICLCVYIYIHTHTCLKRTFLQNLDDSWDNDNTTVQMPPRDPNEPLPAWATDPDNMEITDEEKKAIPEFFCGRYVPTGQLMCVGSSVFLNVVLEFVCVCLCMWQPILMTWRQLMKRSRLYPNVFCGQYVPIGQLMCVGSSVFLNVVFEYVYVCVCMSSDSDKITITDDENQGISGYFYGLRFG